MVTHADASHAGRATVERAGPIGSVSTVTIGWGEAHHEHIYGTRKPALWWIFLGRRKVRIPVNAFVFEHSDGLILFDTGMDRRVINDPDYWPDPITSLFMRNIFEFDFGPEDTLTRQLELAGYSASDVSKAVISHLHADHVGGIREIPQAELVVSEDSWKYMLGPHAGRHMVLRRDIDIPGPRWNRITFEPTDDPSLAPFTHAHDLMGDGSMMLVPTPGHLPGSLSMLVRSNGAHPLLFVADLCYSVDMLMEDRLPGTGDKKQLLESYGKVRALREGIRDLVVLPSHDPTTADRLAQAQGA